MLNIRKGIILTTGVTVLLFSRLAIPHSFYYFAPTVLLIAFYVLFFEDIRIIHTIINFIRSFYLILSVILIVLVQWLITGIFDRMILSQILNDILLVLILFILWYFIKCNYDLDLYYHKTLEYTIFFSLGITVLGIIKLYLSLCGVNLSNLSSGSQLIGPALSGDYNFYALLSLICIILIIPLLIGKISQRKALFFQFVMLLSAINIVLSGSRRAYLALLAFLTIMILTNTASLFCRNSSIKLLAFNTRIFSVSLVSLFLLIFALWKLSPPEIILKAGNALGFKELYFMKYTAYLANQAKSLIPKNADIGMTYNSVWDMSFDSRYPHTGWGSRVYKPVYNLSGPGSEQIPEGSIGYRLDKATNGSVSEGNVYSNSTIATVKLEYGKRYRASVYCFVSADFDGTNPKLSVHGNIKGKSESQYDFSRKGEWQQLVVLFYGYEGDAQIYLNFSKNDSPDFSNLKGYVIFAYPLYDEITFNPYDPSTWATRIYKEIYPLHGNNASSVPLEAKGYLLDNTSDFGTWDGNLYSYSVIGDSLVNEGDRIHGGVFCYVSFDFNGDWVKIRSEGNTIGETEDYYDLNKKGEWQWLEIMPDCSHGTAPVYLYLAKYGASASYELTGYVIFAYPLYEKNPGDINSNKFSINKSVKPGKTLMGMIGLFHTRQIDLYLNLISSNKVEEIKYSPRYGNLSLADPRIERWKYGLAIYKNQYNLLQKLLGGGFGYMRLFNKRFLDKTQQLDYPHNPFISVLLYSGVIGLILYILLLVRTLSLYLLYKERFWPMLLCFLVTFFFSFFSGNDPFDPQIMGFFLIFPFFIHQVLKDSDIKNNK